VWIGTAQLNFQSEVSNQQLATFMRLYVETMDAVIVDVTDDGRVRFDNQELITPTLQERRAILYAAQQEMEALTELTEILSKQER
jgi:hypothetical protein